jgi:hypothetical protein
VGCVQALRDVSIHSRRRCSPVEANLRRIILKVGAFGIAKILERICLIYWSEHV